MRLLVVLFLLLKYTDAAPFSLPWQNLNGYMTSQISVGTPDQFLRVEFNFTATNFYVVDSVCPTRGCLINRRGFNKGSSTTFATTSNQFIEYYHGAIQTGVKAGDSFGQLNVNRRFILPIGILLRTSGYLIRSSIDAVMGLSLYNLSCNT
ncbi:Transporter [Aphelenchoides bicaudatus]|nr:Transporter [Aphelenchoides bicaudatus]